jgi:hypothetical protein
MWFVWDGNARQGPYSETEICRRIAMGEWTLSVFVRPESCLVYRPVVWMMPAWCKFDLSMEETRVRGFEPTFHDATRVAVLETFENQGLKPEFEVPFLSLQPQPAVALDFQPAVKDSSEPFTAGEVYFRPDFQTRGERNEDKHVRQNFPQFEISATPVAPKTENRIEQGEAHEEMAEPKERMDLDVARESDSPTLMVRQPRNNRLGNQSPLMVSEGSVNLIEQTAATQIRIRRVNPTAPRRKPKSFAPRIPAMAKFLPRSWKASKEFFSLLVIFSSLLATLLVVILGFWMMSKRVPSVGTQQEGSSPRKNEKSVQNGISGEKVMKKMTAMQPPADPAEKTIKKLKTKIAADVLSNTRDINAYLSSTPSGQRKFVFVGPLTLVDRPPANCSPCQGSARLPDGVIVTLSSVLAEPWAKVRGVDKIYVKGFVIKTTKFLITVNAMRTTPPR